MLFNNMSFQIPFVEAKLWANLASNSFHQMAVSYVSLQVSRIAIKFSTLTALKWFYVSVNLSHVSLSIFMKTERFLTKFTSVFDAFVYCLGVLS